MDRNGNRRLILIIICNLKLLYFGLMLVFLGMAMIFFRESAIRTMLTLTGTHQISGKKVVIDPGHGGFDPGAKSPGGLLEKDLNLAVALKLKKHFARVGVYCIMVRERDCDFAESGGGATSRKRRDLAYRTTLANQSRADLFLSIHANSFPESQYRGAQTFFNPASSPSKMLAQSIQKHLITQLGPNRRQARPGDFRVLNETKMPSVTVEIGFLSNPAETALLADPAYQERIAAAIYEGVIAFWTKFDPSRESNP